MPLGSTNSWHTQFNASSISTIQMQSFRASPNATQCYRHRCSIGSSGRSSSTSSLTTQLARGGRTRPLKRKVPYTSNPKPTTCNHLNVSHPRPNDTIHMKSVRQVSIVDREVALTVRVTDKPKKLKPLDHVTSHPRILRGESLPDTDHNQYARDRNRPVVAYLSEAFNGIKISISARCRSANGKVHNDHS
jgi:hypothetical protein